jgi:4-amino-4-deoxy-L-arabinose transferase-like glycosyltransferase
MDTYHKKYMDKHWLIGGTFLIVMVASFLGPFYGNYCINDDCAYAKVIKNTIETGKFDPLYVESPMFAHYLFGGISTILLGFSHTSLRIMGIVFSLFLFLSLFFFFEKIGANKKESILLALLVSFNPIVFSLSHSFMSDVAALLWVVVSSYFFVSWFETGKKRDFFLGLIFSALAIFTRSFAIFLPISVILSVLVSSIKKGKLTNKKELIIISLFITITSGFIFLFMNSVIAEKSVSHEGFGFGITNLSRLYGIPMYLGFSFLGAGVLLFDLMKKKIFSYNPIKTIFLALFFLFGVLTAAAFFPEQSLMPYYGNILNSEGLGFNSIIGEKLFFLTDFWPIITIFTLFSSFTLFFVLISKIEANKKNSFLILSTITYLTLLVFFNYFYERFILLILPAFLGLILCKTKELPLLKTALIISVIFFAFFSYFGTVDHFLWQDANQKAINSFKEKGIPLEEINGGYGHCSWNRLECKNTKYITSFSEKKECETIESFKESFLLLKQEVFILECNNNS